MTSTQLTTLELTQAKDAAATVARNTRGTKDFAAALKALQIVGEQYRERRATVVAAHEEAIDMAYSMDVGTYTTATELS